MMKRTIRVHHERAGAREVTAAQTRKLRDALEAHVTGLALARALACYEATGDHGGDCLVDRARTQLELHRSSFLGTGAAYWLLGWATRRDGTTPEALGGDQLRGYVACAQAQAKGEAFDDDAALAAWSRT